MEILVTTLAWISKTQSSTRASRTNFVTVLEPGLARWTVGLRGRGHVPIRQLRCRQHSRLERRGRSIARIRGSMESPRQDRLRRGEWGPEPIESESRNL